MLHRGDSMAESTDDLKLMRGYVPLMVPVQKLASMMRGEWHIVARGGA